MKRLRLAYVFLLVLSLMCSFFQFHSPISNAEHKASVITDDKSLQPTKRHLIICVDGVGFSTILKMREEGRFKMFQEPSRMISPFPTLTNLSLSQIMQPAGVGEASGYEDNYFDWSNNKMRGGLLDRFNESSFIKGTFRELFDYHPSAIKSGLGYALPPFSVYIESLSDVLMLKRKMLASREDPVFFAYTGSTDSLAHLGGEGMVKSFLRVLDDAIKDIARESKGNVRVTIFSDHGNHFRKYKRAGLKEAIRKAGFKLENNINNDRSVVLPQYGLIGCALLFSKEKNEIELAHSVINVKGVDFAAYEEKGVVYLVAPDGAATIERNGLKFRYKATKGDPLGLLSIERELVKQGKSDNDGFIGDGDWFAASCASEKPDAIKRVYEGVTSLVHNRASVVVNFEDGYYSGSSMLDFFAFLQATHGNLGDEQSFGFLIDTERDFHSHVRAEQLWREIGSPTLRKSSLMLAR
jgi:hypothetical protein